MQHNEQITDNNCKGNGHEENVSTNISNSHCVEPQTALRRKKREDLLLLVIYHIAGFIFGNTLFYSLLNTRYM